MQHRFGHLPFPFPPFPAPPPGRLPGFAWGNRSTGWTGFLVTPGRLSVVIALYLFDAPELGALLEKFAAKLSLYRRVTQHGAGTERPYRNANPAHNRAPALPHVRRTRTLLHIPLEPVEQPLQSNFSRRLHGTPPITPLAVLCQPRASDRTACRIRHCSCRQCPWRKPCPFRPAPDPLPKRCSDW